MTIPNLEQKADINYALVPRKIRGLLKPTYVTLLTTHQRLISYQQIDFANTEAVIANNLYEYEAVADVLNEHSERVFQKPGQFTIIAQAPSVQSPQREQFDTVKQTKQHLFRLITAEQLATEAQHIALNGHQKASAILEDKA